MFRTAFILSAIFSIAIVPVAAQAPKKKMIPDFIMTTVNGKRITRQDLKGKVYLLDFWATWCGPCKAASPGIQKLATKLANRNLVVIGADVEGDPNRRGPGYAKKYASDHHYTYTFSYENDGLKDSLGINAIPAFILVDKKGFVRVAVEGIPRSGDPADAIYKFFAPQVKKLLAE